MKLDLIKDKLDELKYKIDLEHIGLQKAKYNIDNAEKLGLTQNSINKYISKMAYYSSKIDINEKALEAYSNCYKDSQNLVDGDYYFKCTLPYEQVDDLSSYQTQITMLIKI